MEPNHLDCGCAFGTTKPFPEYAWDVIERDQEGEFLGVMVCHTYAEVLQYLKEADHESTYEICLTHNVLDRAGQLAEKLYAYVKKGKLPEYFQDSNDRNVERVPERFGKEIR